MDRARDADRLATAAAAALSSLSMGLRSGRGLPAARCASSPTSCATARVSQRHSVDAFGWRTGGRDACRSALAPETHAAIHDGRADAARLLAELGRTTPRGIATVPAPRRSEGGAAVGPAARVSRAAPRSTRSRSSQSRSTSRSARSPSISASPRPRGNRLEDVRELIQRTWAKDVAEHGADGPGRPREHPGRPRSGALVLRQVGLHVLRAGR